MRSINEDSFIVDDDLKLFGVADGVGGHLGGEVASTTAIETLRARIASGDTIAQAIEVANSSVYQRSLRDPDLAGMGTTMTIAKVVGDTALQLGHVGDSRAYLLRGEAFRQITNDHSMVGELVREGQITEEQAALHPRRNVITRAVGMESVVSVDLINLTMQPGDRFLICSDGITDMLRDEDIAQAIIDRSVSPQACAELLADHALANGGIDNLTAVVLDIDPDDTALIDSATPLTMTLETIAPAHQRSRTTAGLRSATLNNSTPQPQVPSAPARNGIKVPSWWGRARWLAITVLPLMLILLASYGALKYNNSRFWYVGDADGRVALFQGSPDAPLGWTPQRKATSNLKTAEIGDEFTRRRVLDNTFCASSSESQVRECFKQLSSSPPISTTITTASKPIPTTPRNSPTSIPSSSASTTTVAGG